MQSLLDNPRSKVVRSSVRFTEKAPGRSLPIGSMGMVYLPTNLPEKSTKHIQYVYIYMLYMDPMGYGLHTWNFPLDSIPLHSWDDDIFVHIVDCVDNQRPVGEPSCMKHRSPIVTFHDGTFLGGWDMVKCTWIGKYHFFRQLWLVLGVKLMQINSNLFSW